MSDLDYKCVAGMEFKATADKKPGSWEAYGAVFNNIDDGGDILMPGCFAKMRTKSNGRIRVPLYHSLNQIVGDAEVIMDGKGLKVKGELNMNLSYAGDAYELMKDGTLDSMSVGFMILKKGAKFSEDFMTRTITKAELFEVSLTPFGMNRKAKVISVKAAAGGLPNIRQFEQWLQTTGGFSQAEAVAIASVGYKAALSDSAMPGVTSDSDRETRESLENVRQFIADIPNLF